MEKEVECFLNFAHNIVKSPVTDLKPGSTFIWSDKRWRLDIHPHIAVSASSLDGSVKQQLIPDNAYVWTHKENISKTRKVYTAVQFSKVRVGEKFGSINDEPGCAALEQFTKINQDKYRNNNTGTLFGVNNDFLVLIAEKFEKH